MMLKRLATTAALCALPILGHAHPGHIHAGQVETNSAFLEGLMHPLTGLDHALALFAVGLLAMRSKAVRVQLPITFIAAMIMGVIASQSGIQLASVEGLVGGSVVLLGLLLLIPTEPTPIVQRGTTFALGLFAVAHGYAHGMESLHAQSAWNLAGLLVATTLLTTLGVLAGLRLSQHRRAIIAFGAFLTGTGLISFI